jgi:hypothetical protein
MAVISPPIKKGGDLKGKLIIVMMENRDKVVSSQEANNTMLSKQTGASGNHQEHIISTDVVKVKVGTQPFDAQKVLLEDAQRVKQLRYMLAFRKGKGSAFLMVQGGADNFDQKDTDAFLAGLDPTGLEAIASSSSSATPSPASPSPTPKH